MVVSNTRFNLEQSEFQAVILAGSGRTLNPLTHGVPKALLPVAGKPMIHYALQWIESCGIKDILVVSVNSAAEQLTSYFKSQEGNRPDLVFLDDKLGSADVLRKVQDKFKNDVLIMSVDSFPAEPCQVLLDIYRVHNAGALINYYQSEPNADHWIGLTPYPNPISSAIECNRLVSCHPVQCISKSNAFPVKMALLREFNTVRLRKLLDAHIYIIRKDLLNQLLEENISSIQKDLIPALIRLQFQNFRRDTPTTTENEEDLEVLEDENSVTESHVGSAQLPLVLAHVSSNDSRNLSGSGNIHGITYSNHGAHSATQCPKISIDSSSYVKSQSSYILQNTDFIGCRANSLSSYSDLNRTISKYVIEKVSSSAEIASRSQVGPESIIGECSRIGERVSVKKSIVGAHCSIGNGVKLVNSVVMDYAVIEDDVKLESTIVCTHAKIFEKSNLKDAIVSAKCVVNRESNIRNEHITS